MRKLVPGSEGQQGDVPGLLDGPRQTALVCGAYTGQTAGHDLAAFSHKPLQQTNIPVGDGVNLLGAELADLFAAEELAATTGTTGTAGASSGTAAAWASGTATWTTSGGALCRASFGCFYLVLIRHLVSSSFSWLSGLD
jgi:hypothetical protein